MPQLFGRTSICPNCPKGETLSYNFAIALVDH